jgi:hypothetical protein
VIFDAAALISRRTSDVSSTAAAPVFSSKRSSLVVPGIGTIHGFYAGSQAEVYKTIILFELSFRKPALRIKVLNL